MKLPDIIKAKKKPLEVLELSSLGVQPRQRLRAVHFAAPTVREKGVRVKDVNELLAALQSRGLV